MGAKIYQWIKEQTEKGYTVYVTNYMHSWKISAKHLPQLRVRGDHCELQCGKRWDSINYCKITASK